MSARVPDALSVQQILDALGVPVTRLVSDSRRVEHGDTFAAYRGEARDGRDFVAQAIARGAGSVLWDDAADDRSWRAEWLVPHLPVAELKTRLGEIADVVYGHPSQAMWIIGITGTNGKTSCAHWLARGLSAVGRRTAVLGTLGNGFPDTLVPALNTTPDAAELHEILARLHAQGAVAAAMEVSSHGLAQYRLNGMKFDLALFTNLTRDHLDYHGDLEAYGAAKAQLFEWPTLRQAIINADDQFGAQLIARRTERGLPCLSYGFAAGEVRGEGLTWGAQGFAFDIATPWGRGHVQSGLIGAFNAANLLGVIGVLLASDVGLDEALRAASSFAPVAGRMQRAGGAGKPLVVVDYAHTPDALEKALVALRPFVAQGGELVCVFGCGGDRDSGKRPQMGAIATQLADRVLVTSDNPRGEDPDQIIAAIVRGVPKAAVVRVQVEADRRHAIRAAIAAARANDVVLVAGKGHEPYQEIDGVRHPFDDLQQAHAALRDWVATQ
jgi:UDP-N-acetylmuramoyl-L-alanyl-D-glutamate--2,6-diaminopimelate ligase